MFGPALSFPLLATRLVASPLDSLVIFCWPRRKKLHFYYRSLLRRFWLDTPTSLVLGWVMLVTAIVSCLICSLFVLLAHEPPEGLLSSLDREIERLGEIRHRLLRANLTCVITDTERCASYWSTCCANQLCRCIDIGRDRCFSRFRQSMRAIKFRDKRSLGGQQRV